MLATISCYGKIMKYSFLSLGRSEHDKQQRRLLGDGRVRRRRSEHVYYRKPYAHTLTAALMDNLLLNEYDV